MGLTMLLLGAGCSKPPGEAESADSRGVQPDDRIEQVGQYVKQTADRAKQTADQSKQTDDHAKQIADRAKQADDHSKQTADRVRRIEAMSTEYCGRFSEVPTITASQAAAGLGDGSMVLVDVRSAPERDVSMIAGAISSQQYEADPSAYGDRTIVLYCTIGYRSGKYARKLLAEEQIQAVHIMQ